MSREMSRPIRLTPWIRRNYPAKKPLPRRYPEIWAHRAIIVVVWGAMLIAFFCFLRKGNFTVNKVDAFNSRKHLYRGDVALLWQDRRHIHVSPL